MKCGYTLPYKQSRADHVWLPFVVLNDACSGSKTLTCCQCPFESTFDLRAEDVLVFNLRRRTEQASFAAEEDCFNLDAGLRKHASFPAFVYQHVKNRHGIVHMVRSVRVRRVNTGS